MSKKPLNEFALDSADDQNQLMPPGEVDNEGAMAKADLYKLANYSVKLFKKINDEDQLESWVQAKITKAADYIASVYHYLEYELKFNEYGAKLDHSDMYSESEKHELKNKLNEAKEMLKAIKLAQAEKLEEAKSPKAKKVSDKDWDGDGTKESPKDEVWGSRFKAAKKAGKMEESWDDDDEDDDVKRADSELKKKGIKLPKVKDKEVPIKKTAKDKEEEQLDELSHATLKSYADKKGDQMFVQKKPASGKDLTNYRKAIDKMHKKEDDDEMNEGSGAYQLSDPKHPKFKANYEKFKKANPDKKLADFVAAQAKKEKSGGLDEAAPSAGLSAEKKSATVKKAKAGGDIGKKGKGFAKVEKAAKASGAKDPKAVAAAAMWKNIKRESKEMGEARGRKESHNFTMDDINRLSTIHDIEELRAQAIALITANNSDRPMQPEKVAYFTSALQNKPTKFSIIKTLTDMILGGHGEHVIDVSGKRNAYRDRFGESGPDDAGECSDNVNLRESAELNNIKALTKRLLG